MIPAKLTCPLGWTKEYYGYLMTENYMDNIATFECVDADPVAVAGSIGNDTGGDFHHVEANCNASGMLCPPYVAAKELTCVVCSM